MFGRITHIATAALGLGYPAFASFKAIETASPEDDPQWLTYWVIFSALTVVETFIYFILDWIPLYDEIKLVFIAWLVLPQTNGAKFIYVNYIKDHFAKRDQYIEAVKANLADPKAAQAYITTHGQKAYDAIKTKASGFNMNSINMSSLSSTNTVTPSG